MNSESSKKITKDILEDTEDILEDNILCQNPYNFNNSECRNDESLELDKHNDGLQEYENLEQP